MAKKGIRLRLKKPSRKGLVAHHIGGGFDPTPYEIAASGRKLSAALTATSGQSGVTVSPIMAGAGGQLPDPLSPVPITPTVYPDTPDGPVTVQNFFTININSAEFKTFNTTMDALVNQIGQSNEISGEVRAQLLSDIMVGREVLKGPKPSRDLIKIFLVTPLKWLALTTASAAIGGLAKIALEALLQMMM